MTEAKRLTKDFVPTCCKPRVVKDSDGTERTIEPEYEGKVVLYVPNYAERQMLYGLVEVEVRPGDTEEKITERVIKSGGGVSYLARVSEHVPKFLAELAIRRKDDGHVFTWDDMQYDSDMQNVITQIASELTKKYRVGNPKSPS